MFSSGNIAVDRFIEEGYDTVLGMSSRFAATICGHVMRRQSELGVAGISWRSARSRAASSSPWRWAWRPASARSASTVFDWPDAGRLRALPTPTARGTGSRASAMTALRGEHAHAHRAPASRMRSAGRARFVHIDGDHAPDSLRARSRSGRAAAASTKGIICARRHAASRLSAPGRGGARLAQAASRRCACCASSTARTSWPRRNS